MDNIRRQQINEIHDRDMNLRVLALQRKQVALWGPEDGETGELLNRGHRYSQRFSNKTYLFLLEKRRADINIITQWSFTKRENVYGYAMSTLGKISEVVDAYNALVSSYLINNTTQAKTHYTIIYKKNTRS